MVKTYYSLLILLLTLACNTNYDSDCDYSDCLSEEPYEAEMKIKVSINKQNSFVPIWIYEGKYNDTNYLIYADTAHSEKYRIILPLNVQYYVKAKYKTANGNIVYAIDGVFFKKISKTECDSTCWYIKNDVMDVRLK